MARTVLMYATMNYVSLTLSVLVMLIGAIVYGLANGKASELGRIAFFCGLLAVLLGHPGNVITAGDGRAYVR